MNDLFVPEATESNQPWFHSEIDGDSGMDFGVSPSPILLNDLSILRYDALLREKRNGRNRHFYPVHLFIRPQVYTTTAQPITALTETRKLIAPTKELISDGIGELYAVDLTRVPELLRGTCMALIQHRLTQMGIKMSYDVQRLTASESIL